jgi:2-iminobutanoate/2-iminopropanoate deaminase
MPSQFVITHGLARLPAFSHAAVAGDFVFVSGTLGTVGDTLDLAEGGVGAQTAQAVANIERILASCDADLSNVVKVQVVLTDLDDFAAMNAAYLAAFGDHIPARITFGAALAMNAAVEIECIAYLGS